MSLTESEKARLAKLWLQKQREAVSPKLEAFRNPCRVKIARGGRGAGAKSMGVSSLLVQRGNYEPTHVVGIREHQNTLEESSWKTIVEAIERLGYRGWKVTDRYIDKPSVGTHFIFRGMSDFTADNIQSLSQFDIAWVDEGQKLSAQSCVVLFPTIRKPGSEIWVTMNPDLDVDPIIAHTVGRKDLLIVDMLPGKVDNPWWTDELQAEMEADFARDPVLAEHVWNGAPRSQSERSIFALADVQAAMSRKSEAPSGAVEIGVDVARFGDDRSQIYKRRGYVVVDEKTFNGADTQHVARVVWDMAERDPKVRIKVDDSGVGGGVTDKLRDLGAHVIPVLNGNPPNDSTLYTTCADEQWFTFPLDRACLPNDVELRAELTTRMYRYTPDDRRKIEPKAEFKKRYGRSPDKADALMLCFYPGPVESERGGVATLNVW